MPPKWDTQDSRGDRGSGRGGASGGRGGGGAGGGYNRDTNNSGGGRGGGSSGGGGGFRGGGGGGGAPVSVAHHPTILQPTLFNPPITPAMSKDASAIIPPKNLQLAPKMPPGTYNAKAQAKNLSTTANVALCDFTKIKEVFQYDVVFEPEVMSKVAKRKLFYRALHLKGTDLNYLSYDGNKVAHSLLPYTSMTLDIEKLIQDVQQRGGFVYDDVGVLMPTIKPDSSGGGGGGAKRAHQLIHIKPTASFSIKNVMDLTAKTTTTNNKQVVQFLEHVQPIESAFNEIFRHIYVVFCLHAERNLILDTIFAKDKTKGDVAKKDFDNYKVLFGCNQFTLHGTSLHRFRTITEQDYLGSGLHAVKGVAASLRWLESGLALNVDLSAIASFAVGTPLIDIMLQVSSQDRPGDKMKTLYTAPPSVYNQLLTLRAKTTHLQNNMVVPLQKVGPRVKDVPQFTVATAPVSATSPQGVKNHKPNTKYTLKQYYQTFYNIKIDENLLTFVREKKQVDPKDPKKAITIYHYYPIEVLTLHATNHSSISTLNAEQQSKMLQCMTSRPHERLKAAQEQLKTLTTALQYMKQQKVIANQQQQAAAKGGNNNNNNNNVSDVNPYAAITITPQFTQAPSRVLAPPVLQVMDNNRVQNVLPTDGQARLPFKFQYITPASAPTKDIPGGVKYQIAFMPLTSNPQCTQECIDTYLNSVVTNATAKGLDLSLLSRNDKLASYRPLNQRGISRPDQKEETETLKYLQQIATYNQNQIHTHKSIKNNDKPLSQIIILAITDDNSPMYSFIKRLTESELGITTQFAEVKKVIKNVRGGKLDGYVQNILLKLNVKLGGLNYVLTNKAEEDNPLLMRHVVKNPKPTIVTAATAKQIHPTLSTTVPIMTMGIDVYHEPSARSNAAFVASYDQALTRYNAHVAQQPIINKSDNALQSVEVIPTPIVTDATYDLVQQFQQRNQHLFPQHVVVYRDGVSDGQMSLLLQHEVPGLIAGLQKAYITTHPASNYAYNPTITVLVGVKRHTVRFQPEKGNDDAAGRDSRTENHPSGTVIDEKIVNKFYSNFYLLSQASLLGTGKPMDYRMVYCSSTTRVSMNDLELLTHYLSYGIQRCPKAVRLCSPLFFADLLAYRSRLYAKNYERKDKGFDGTWQSNGLTDQTRGKMFWL